MLLITKLEQNNVFDFLEFGNNHLGQNGCIIIIYIICIFFSFFFYNEFSLILITN